MRSVRIWFAKLDMARFISHLDLNRCMSRAVRRASIPLWYTEGFNPHPYMNFSLALPLGIESVAESMDIKVNGDITNDELKSKLNAVMPSGIKILRVTEPVMKANKIAYAEYEIKIDVNNDDVYTVESWIKNCLSQKYLGASKMGKSGGKKIEKEINLIDYIKSFDINFSGKTIGLDTYLKAGTNDNLNPILLMDTLKKELRIDAEKLSIMRKRLLTENMEDFA